MQLLRENPFDFDFVFKFSRLLEKSIFKTFFKIQNSGEVYSNYDLFFEKKLLFKQGEKVSQNYIEYSTNEFKVVNERLAFMFDFGSLLFLSTGLFRLCVEFFLSILDSALSSDNTKKIIFDDKPTSAFYRVSTYLRWQEELGGDPFVLEFPVFCQRLNGFQGISSKVLKVTFSVEALDNVLYRCVSNSWVWDLSHKTSADVLSQHRARLASHFDFLFKSKPKEPVFDLFDNFSNSNLTIWNFFDFMSFEAASPSLEEFTLGFLGSLANALDDIAVENLPIILKSQFDPLCSKETSSDFFDFYLSASDESDLKKSFYSLFNFFFSSFAENRVFYKLCRPFCHQLAESLGLQEHSQLLINHYLPINT